MSGSGFPFQRCQGQILSAYPGGQIFKVAHHIVLEAVLCFMHFLKYLTSIMGAEYFENLVLKIKYNTSLLVRHHLQQ